MGYRKQLRLKTHDYSSKGHYFVTICTAERKWLFGRIEEGNVKLNSFDEIVQSEWLRTPRIRPNVCLDEFVVMPNHFHAIIQITERRGDPPDRLMSVQNPEFKPHARATRWVAPTSRLCSGSLGAVMGQFKSTVTKRIGFRVWQRNYYEHMIRNETDLNRIRKYIQLNPVNWEIDPENTGICHLNLF